MGSIVGEALTRGPGRADSQRDGMFRRAGVNCTSGMCSIGKKGPEMIERRTVKLLIGASLVFTTGCGMFRGSSKTTTEVAKTTNKPGAPTGPGYRTDNPFGIDNTVPTPADMMFASSEPFSAPPSSINVFGEMDGVGPAPYNGGGKSGFQQQTFVDEGYDSDVKVTPDGKSLLFASTRHSVHPDIYIQKIDGMSVTQITYDPADDAFPVFNHDMSRIAFASNRSGNWDIYVMDADGKNVEQITRTSANEIHPTFSPDGSKIAYSSLGSRTGQWELWTIDLGSNERKMIGYGLFPQWSPRSDVDRIAFQRARQRGTRWFSAWTLDLVGGEAKNVTEIAFSTNAAIVGPSWNQDGTKLAFTTIVDPTLASPATQGGQAKGTTQDVWTINADGTDRNRLTDGRGVNAAPAWGKDGRIYFISDRGGSEAIWSVAANDVQDTFTADTKGNSAPSETTHDDFTADTQGHE